MNSKLAIFISVTALALSSAALAGTGSSGGSSSSSSSSSGGHSGGGGGSGGGHGGGGGGGGGGGHGFSSTSVGAHAFGGHGGGTAGGHGGGYAIAGVDGHGMGHSAAAAVTAHTAALHATAQRVSLRERTAHEAAAARPHPPGKPRLHRVVNYTPNGPYAIDRVKHWAPCSDGFRSNPAVEAGCDRPNKARVDPVTGMPTG